MAKARKMEGDVKVQGLNDFRRQLKKIVQEGGVDGIALLKEANFRIASMVADKAQGRASSVGKMQSRAASSLRPGRQQARAVISGGGARVPFFWGAEFGSLRYKQFETWKKPGGGNTGYFLFPTMKAESKNIIEMYGDELEKIAKQAFPN